ncbi:hypothetical protein [Candidatus Hodarchaeum mangrovi]
MSEFSGTEKWIELVLKELKEATTEEIINRVAIFNTDCADNIPHVLTTLRLQGKVGYRIDKVKEEGSKRIIWFLLKID